VDKAGFGLYDLKSKSWITQSKIQAHGVYFTHFTPSQLLAFNKLSILELDPVNYNIVMYDSIGRKIDSFNRSISDWRTLDKRVQKRLDDNLMNISGKEVIGYLNRHRLKIDRCQQIVSLSPDTFLVSYYRYDTARKDVQYLMDFFSIENNKINLIKGGIRDIYSNDSAVVVDSSFPSMHTFNAHCFSERNVVIFRNVCPTNYMGRTIGDISELEEAYFVGQDGVLALFIFELNL